MFDQFPRTTRSRCLTIMKTMSYAPRVRTVSMVFVLWFLAASGAAAQAFEAALQTKSA